VVRYAIQPPTPGSALKVPASHVGQDESTDEREPLHSLVKGPVPATQVLKVQELQGSAFVPDLKVPSPHGVHVLSVEVVPSFCSSSPGGQVVRYAIQPPTPDSALKVPASHVGQDESTDVREPLHSLVKGPVPATQVLKVQELQGSAFVPDLKVPGPHGVHVLSVEIVPSFCSASPGGQEDE
jgi:hypothetical protein